MAVKSERKVTGKVRREEIDAVTRMRSRLVLVLAAALLALLVLEYALAGEPSVKKRFPPYPDVWGYELPYPRPGDRGALINAYRLDDGEIAFLVKRKTYQARRADGSVDFWYDYGLLEFFTNRLRAISKEEYVRFADSHRAVRIGNLASRRAALSDGTSVESRTRFHDRCYVHGAARIIVRDSAGRVARDAHLFYLRDDVRNVPQDPACEGAGGASYVRVRADQVVSMFIPLDDGTFLVANFRGNIVIRFDRDLRSRFPLNDRVFLVDRASFEALYGEATREHLHNQVVEDALVSFLLKVRSRGRNSR